MHVVVIIIIVIVIFLLVTVLVKNTEVGRLTVTNPRAVKNVKILLIP